MALSVRQKLSIATAIALLVLLSLFSTYNYVATKTSVVNHSSDRIRGTARSLRSYINSWIKLNDTILTSIANFTDTDDRLIDALDQGREAGNYLYTYLGTSSGDMTLRPPDPLPEGYDPRQRPWYKQAQSAGRTILTEPYLGATGQLMITFAQPSSRGVTGADIKLDDITHQVLNIRLGETGQALLINASRNILVASNTNLNEQNIDTLISDGSVSEQISRITFNGVDVFAVLLPITDSNWSVMVTMARTEALEDLHKEIVSSLISTALIIILSVTAISLIIGILLRPLRKLSDAMSDISKGEADLTQRLSASSSDEIGILSQSFNNFIESIHQMVIDVIDSAAYLIDLSQQSREAAATNNTSVQTQQEEMSQVAAAIHEMTSTSASVADNAKVTADSAEAAKHESETSEEYATSNRQRMSSLTDEIEQTTIVINQLNDHAQQINSILATIQGIAEQTNLLALNAAIEAARAGEQGRGFAVVADEVRALSQRTHEATGEIQNMIEALGERTSKAVDQMSKSKVLVENTMNTAQSVSESQASIRDAISNINQQALMIAEASREQNQATEEINRITNAIQEESQHLATNVEAAFQMAEQLEQLGAKVQTHLKRFKT